jgi:hypothetical protein
MKCINDAQRDFHRVALQWRDRKLQSRALKLKSAVFYGEHHVTAFSLLAPRLRGGSGRKFRLAKVPPSEGICAVCKIAL